MKMAMQNRGPHKGQSVDEALYMYRLQDAYAAMAKDEASGVDVNFRQRGVDERARGFGYYLNQVKDD
jgi:hypothetical protein